MVQVIQRTPGFAQFFGEGLKGALIPQFQQQYQRGLIKQSMQDVRDLAKNPNANAFDLASALISSTAGVPGAEKYIGQLFPLLNEQLQRQRSLTNSPLGMPGAPTTGGGQELTEQGKKAQAENKKTAPKIKPGGAPQEAISEEEAIQQPQPSVFNILPPTTYDPSLAAPGQVPTMQLPYPDPMAFHNIRMEARRQNYTPDMEENFVNQAKEANDAARQAFTFQQDQYKQFQTEKQDYLNNFKEVKQYIDTNAKEFEDPDDKEVALKFAEDVMKEKGGSPQEVLSEVKQKMRPYQAAVNNLKKMKRPWFGLSKDHAKLLKKDAQMMVDMGQKDKLRLILAANGYGELEEARLLNDLPEPIQNHFKKLEEKKFKFYNPSDAIPHHLVLEPDADEASYLKHLNKGFEKRNKELGEMRQYIKDNLTSGDYKHPGTNLLLMRKNLTNLGLDWVEAGNLIKDAISEKAVENKGFTLDGHQINDSTKLTYPPLAGDGYLNNLLQYWFFNKE